MTKSGVAGKNRLIGAVVPVGALRGSESTGVGEFLDLIEFARLCVDMNVGLIQILPVNDTGYESSPYSALTAFALHPLYLRLSALEEAAPFSKEIEELGKKFDREIRFPYYQVICAKMELLRKIYNANAGDSGVLAKWIEENSWVKPYAVFRRLKESNKEKSWKEWGSYRQPKASDIALLWDDPALRGEHLFWAWLQKALDRQFSQAAQAIRDMGLLLEGDLPILMNEDSCDVWANPGIFRSDLSAALRRTCTVLWAKTGAFPFITGKLNPRMATVGGRPVLRRLKNIMTHTESIMCLVFSVSGLLPGLIILPFWDGLSPVYR